MFSISESYFAELHNLSNADLKELFVSFTTAFPFVVDVLISPMEYDTMLAEAQEISGFGHPKSTRPYKSDKFKWSEYHPSSTSIWTKNRLMMSGKIGFKTASDAIRFKLKWAS
jgi:hypothetical protein